MKILILLNFLKKTLIFFLLSSISLSAQERNIYKELGVKGIEEYIFNPVELKDTNDSTLIKKITIDSLGRVYSKKIFYKKGSKLEYRYFYVEGKLVKTTVLSPRGERIHAAYKYNRNGKLRLKKNYSNGSLVGKEFFKFDSKGSIRSKVTRNFSYTKKKKYVYLYNQKGQKIKQFSKNTNQDDLEFEYDEHGNEVKIFRIDAKKGRVIHITKEYNSENIGVKRREVIRTQFLLPEIKAKIYTAPGDIWTHEYIYNKRGLLVEVRQKLNNILVGIKKKKYLF